MSSCGHRVNEICVFERRRSSEAGSESGGVEIVLNMREKIEAMQQQIEGFIATLNRAAVAFSVAEADLPTRRSARRQMAFLPC